MDKEGAYLKDELYRLIRADNSIFDFLQEAALDGLWYWDLEDVQFEWMNDRFWEILGYNPEEMPHSPEAWQNIIFSEDRDRALSAFQAALSDPNYSYDLEVRYLHREGHTVWIRCRGKMIRDNSGKPIRMLGAHNEITALKENELKLRNSINRLEVLLNSTGDLLFVVDHEMQIREYYSNGTQKFWINPEDALDRNFDELKFPVDAHEEIKQTIGNALKTQNPSVGEFILNNSNKSHYFSISASLSQQEPESVICVIREITEQKLAEQQLRDSEEQFRAIFQQDKNIRLFIEPDNGRIIEANQAAVNFYGFTYKELLSMSAFELNVLPESEVRCKLEKALANDQEKVHCIHKLAGGENRNVEIGVMPIRFKGKTRLFLNILDVTEAMVVERELQESQKKLNLFFENSLYGSFFMMLDKPVEWNDKAEKDKLLDYIFEHQRITKVNQTMLRQYGAKHQDEFLGLTPMDFFREKPSYGRKLWKELFDKGRLKIETEEVKFDGSPVLFEGDYLCLYDEEGRITGHFGVQQDVTERKKAELDLIRTKEMLEETNRVASVGGWEINLRDGVHNYSGVLKQILDIEASSDLNLLQEITTGDNDDLTKLNQVLQQAIKKGEAFDEEVRLLTAAGRLVWVKVIGKCELEDQQVKRVYGTLQDITQMKQAEEKLKESQQLLHKLTNNVPGAVTQVEMDAMGNLSIPFVSKGFEELQQFTTEQVITNPLLAFDHVHPEDLPGFMATIEHSRQTLTEQSYEFRNRFEGDQFKWFNCVARPERKEGGRTVWYGIIEDITENKRAALELHRAKELLEQTGKISRVGGYELDLVTQKVSWSQVTRMIHEVEEDFIPDFESGINFYQEGENRERIIKAITNLAEGGLEFDSEFRLITAKGKKIWVRVIGKPEYTKNQVTRIYGTFQDITFKKEKELEIQVANNKLVAIQEELKKQKDELEVFFNTALDLLCIANFEGEFIRVNKAWEDILGYSVDELNGRRFLDFIHPDDLQPTLNVISELNNGNGILNFVNRYRTRQGDYRHIEWHSKPLGKLIYAAARDITPRILTEEALIRAKDEAVSASKAKSEFLANMSHEIRTPLNSVIGFSDLLIKTSLNDTQRQYMESVHSSANSLLDLINDILDFSKIEAGKLELTTEKTDLWELTAQIVDVVKFKTAEKGIELLLHLSNDLPRYAWIDEIRIRQVLINLLGNAVKFTESGEIELSLQVRSGLGQNEEVAIEFSVRDTGKGISPENRRKIFEAFSQEDGSTTRKYGGTGLGLTISNKLLSLMDSQLELESESGRGSRFYFVLNLKTESGNLEIFDGLEKVRHVLIIDDNTSNSRILQQMLLLKSISSDLAANGIEALGKISTNRKYDVVITDYHMPFMDGIEVIRQIRHQLHLSAEDLPVILLHSSPNDAQINEACKEFQVQAQVNKPITISRLFDLLARIKKSGKPEIDSGTEIEVGNYSAGIKILVADDNEFNMLLSKSMLKTFIPEVELIEAFNGKQAVALFSERKPDLVLMDVQMPVMSGYEASSEIRKSENGIHIPIIALTAGTVKGERERCIDAGMDDYLSKPVLIETLKETLKKWLPAVESEFSGKAKMQTDVLNNLQHFNRTELLDRLGGKEKTINEILNLVRNGALSRLVNSLKEANEKPDNVEQVRSLAHSIKGAGNGACFEILANYASQLELLEISEQEKAGELVSLLVDEVAFLEKSLNI